MNVRRDYEKRVASVLPQLRDAIEAHFRQNIDFRRIESFRIRVKSLQSFLDKAKKRDDDNKPVYADPLWDITDQIGARVVVRFKSEVPIVESLIRKCYRFIEREPKEPKSPNEFGYFGLHFLLAIPHEIKPDSFSTESIPDFFELQIKTLFQHAWSEAEHDITYKPSFSWTNEHRRRIAFTAAQSWGADQIFDEIYSHMQEYREN